jgi:COP9 signalosome complex subunit 3
MEICRDTKQSIRAILPLKQAINKIGSGEHITPQHHMFVLACITAKCYKAALPILERFVFKIGPELTGIESVDTRLYFYYGGVCFAGMKRFDKALQFFEAAISTPAVVISAIMVEAYKKYILVSLCHKGEVPTLPRYTHASLVRVFKQMFPAYEEFMNSFATRSVEDLSKVAENHAEQFTKDKNIGLVKQAIQALYRQNIQRLTKTYITLSLQSITEQTSLPNISETERRVFRMIQNGQVFATINQKDGMVEFLENPEKYNNNKTLQYLDRQIHQSITLTNVVTKIDEEIGLEDKYLHKIIQAERTPSRFGEGAEDEIGHQPFPGYHV